MAETVVMIMGRSGAGKSTLERELIEKHPTEFNKVVSVTTRPKRAGEVDGVDYWFKTRKQFDDLDLYDELIQTTQFAGNCYGSLYADYITAHKYATLCTTPAAARSFIPVLTHRLPSSELDIAIIYFNLSEELLRSNMLERGDNLENIERRLQKDDLEQQFKRSGLTAGYTVTDDTLTRDLADQVYHWLEQRRKKYAKT